jgi:hypothetical protein
MRVLWSLCDWCTQMRFDILQLVNCDWVWLSSSNCLRRDGRGTACFPFPPSAVSRSRQSTSVLKASLNRFIILSTAERECGDGMQTEEHIFRDYKLYKDQRARMMDILSENCKKIPKVSYRALKIRRKTISARRLLLHKQHSYIYMK